MYSEANRKSYNLPLLYKMAENISSVSSVLKAKYPDQENITPTYTFFDEIKHKIGHADTMNMLISNELM